MMPINLPKLEARLRDLIEGSARRLFPPGDQTFDLAAQFVAAMQSNLHTQSDGKLCAPNLFIWSLPPAQAENLQEDRTFLDNLEKTIQRAGQEAEVGFPSPPVIRVIADPELGAQEFRILAQFDVAHLTETLQVTAPAETGKNTSPSGAFLILNNGQVFPLNTSVVNLGRSLENQVVIEDIAVSRLHAQLRFIHGHYVIFDLDSTSGTFVNGKRITESPLQPGDVISLAKVNLIFGQDYPPGAGETQKLKRT